MGDYKVSDQRDPWGPKRVPRQEIVAREEAERAKHQGPDIGWTGEAQNYWDDNSAASMWQGVKGKLQSFKERMQKSRSSVPELQGSGGGYRVADPAHRSGMTKEEVASLGPQNDVNEHGQIPAKHFGPSRDQLPGGMTKDEFALFNEEDPDDEPLQAGQSSKKPQGTDPRTQSGSSGNPANAPRDIDPRQVAETTQEGESGELPAHEQEAYDAARKALEGKTAGLDLKPLGALLDGWYGGNLAGAAPPRYQPEDKEMDLAELKLKLAHRKTQFKEKGQDRTDRLQVALAKAKGDEEKGRLRQALFLSKIKAAKASGGAKEKGPKDELDTTAFRQFIQKDAKNIENLAKDRGVSPTDIIVQVREAAALARSLQPDLSHQASYAQALRTVKNKMSPDVQKDDGGDGVGLWDKLWE